MKNKWLIASILVLILATLLTAIVYYSWQVIDLASQSGVRWRAFTNDIVSAEGDEELRFSTDGPGTLDIQNDIGNITVSAGTGDEIVIKAHKTAWGATQAGAQTALENLKIVSDQENNTVTIRVEPVDTVYVFAFRARPDSVAFTVTVPPNTGVITRSNVGDITLEGVKHGADLQTDFGDVSVMNTIGNLSVDTNSGEVTVQGIRAPRQTVDLRSEFGSIILEDAAAGDIEMHSNSGRLGLQDVTATRGITLGSEFGSIEFTSGVAEGLNIEANSGGIILSDLTIEEPVKLSTEFGDITLRNVDAPSYDLRSNSGNISLDSAQGTVWVHTEFGDIEVSNGEQATLDLQTNSGSIVYSGSLGSGPHMVKTEFGNISLTLPGDTSLTVDLGTEFGKVKSEFAITLSGEFSEKHLNGTINGEGPNLTASTNSGNITFSISNP
jgi:DUF4097 and DUF4098 domain-containing protein YvlB